MQIVIDFKCLRLEKGSKENLPKNWLRPTNLKQ
jgi:hypothetical protein